MRIASIAMVIVFLLAGCVQGRPQATSTPDPSATGPGDAPNSTPTTRPPTETELHLVLRQAIANFGFRLEYNLTARGTCVMNHFGYWQLKPDESAPHFFYEYRGPGVYSVGPFLVHPVAHVHDANHDTRKFVPSPWITLEPLDLEGHYEQNFTMTLGGTFARGPIAYTIGLRDLKPNPDGIAYAFHLRCDTPFEVLHVERLHQVHLFTMLSMTNGTGHSIGNTVNENDSDSLAASFGEASVRYIGSDYQGTGRVRLRAPDQVHEWELRTTSTRMNATGPSGAYRLELDRTSMEDPNGFQGLLAGVTAVATFAELGPAR